MRSMDLELGGRHHPSPLRPPWKRMKRRINPAHTFYTSALAVPSSSSSSSSHNMNTTAHCKTRSIRIWWLIYLDIYCRVATPRPHFLLLLLLLLQYYILIDEKQSRPPATTTHVRTHSTEKKNVYWPRPPVTDPQFKPTGRAKSPINSLTLKRRRRVEQDADRPTDALPPRLCRWIDLYILYSIYIPHLLLLLLRPPFHLHHSLTHSFSLSFFIFNLLLSWAVQLELDR